MNERRSKTESLDVQIVAIVREIGKQYFLKIML